MTDDAALLLRVSVFGLVAGVVYWFLSYEALGTVALLVLGAGPGFAALFIIRQRRHQGVGLESRMDMLRRFAGVPSGDEPPGPKSLEGEDLAVLPAGRAGRLEVDEPEPEPGQPEQRSLRRR